MDKEQFEVFIIGYLDSKGITDIDSVQEMISFLTQDTVEVLQDGVLMLEALNILLFKDIILGLWNDTLKLEQALYQLINAVDLHLAFRNYLYKNVDSSIISYNFKLISNKMDAISTTDDFKSFLEYIDTDTSWVPIQKDYRFIFVYLLKNLLSFLYCDKAYDTLLLEDTSI